MPASSKRRSWISLPAALLAAALLSPASTAQAGSQADPEVADIAGDANFINGQNQVAGFPQSPDTRPASFDSFDLVAAWLETAYEARQVLDPATGEVLRVEHDPTALVAYIKTVGPMLPADPWISADYQLWVQVPGCRIRLFVRTNRTTSGAFMNEWAGTCTGELSPAISHTIEGNVATMTIPMSSAEERPDDYFLPGATFEVAARVQGSTHAGLPTSFLYQDEAIGSRAFTIGQDVPADIDCGADPGNEACQP